jgi:hypothetical protein
VDRNLHLKAPNSVVIDFSLPLHESITHQWKTGDLQRVTAEGEPWPGDQYDLSDLLGTEAAEGTQEPETGGDGQEPDPDRTAEPVRPAVSAPKRDWQAYATALGACSADEATGMTRDALVKLCTPSEIDPLVPKE